VSEIPNGFRTHGQDLGSDSLGTIDLHYDGPGDNTIQPCPPELLDSARAMREKLIRYGALEVPPKPNAAPPK